jgi:hypothetical protein
MGTLLSWIFLVAKGSAGLSATRDDDNEASVDTLVSVGFVTGSPKAEATVRTRPREIKV